MNQNKQKRKPSKAVFICILILLVFAVIIGIVRIILPIITYHKINSVLSEMVGYKGHIKTFDYNLQELGFEIGGFEIKRVSTVKQLHPFFYAEKILTYIDWESLWRGEIVGRLLVYGPEVNFVNGPNKIAMQTGTEGDIFTALKKLKTYKINQVDVFDGKIMYLDSYVSPKVKLHVYNLQSKISNIKIVIKKEQKLPSRLFLTGKTTGQGKVILEARFDAMKQVPDFDVNLKVTNLQLNAIKDLTNAYANFTFEKGSLSLYGEMAMKNGQYKGYLKPIMENIKVFDIKKDEDQHLFHIVREALIGAVFEITKNKQKKQIATEIPFEGDLKEFKVEIFNSISNVFKNKFASAYKNRLDNSIDIHSTKKAKTKAKTH